jgi:UDP-N-acetylglucosamine 3-dehydrogenase
MGDLRAGLIGVGSMGRHHARVLRGLHGVELVGIADPAGDRHGVAGNLPVLGSIEELIAVGVDYVTVAVPTTLHEEVALALADAGVHALIEKPLASDLDAAERIASAFERAGLVGGVGHIERYNPAVQSLRSRLEQGDLGEVYQIVTRRQGPFPERIADVGVVQDLAPHDIDLAAWVTRSTYVSVAAQTAHRSGRKHEDLVSVTGRVARGARAQDLVYRM